jgi:hypothetical protein
VSYFTTNFGTTSNPPTFNSVAAFTDRDIAVFLPQNTDILVKVNTTQCPIVNGAPACSTSVGPTCEPPGVDTDGDGACDPVDNCPTIANSDQSDTDGDLVGQVCDNCTAVANAKPPAAFFTGNIWWTLTGGQRDDDHDGFGNVCDGDFPGTTGGNVGPADTAQYKASLTKSRTGDTCGTLGTRPCAIFDLNLTQNTDAPGGNIGPADTARYKALLTFPAGPKCAACPLACTAGTTGSCL